jgi:hypothetical protein
MSLDAKRIFASALRGSGASGHITSEFSNLVVAFSLHHQHSRHIFGATAKMSSIQQK